MKSSLSYIKRMDEFKEVIWSIEDQAEDNNVHELFELISEEYNDLFSSKDVHDGSFGMIKGDDYIVIQYSFEWGDNEESQVKMEYKYTYGK